MSHLSSNLIYDPIIGESLFGDQGRVSGVTPERELMLALLADAINCHRKYRAAKDPRCARIFQETDQWIFSDDEQQHFSFLNVCEALSLDAAYVRRGIVRGLAQPALVEKEKLASRSRGRVGQIKSGLRRSVRAKNRLRRFKG